MPSEQVIAAKLLTGEIYLAIVWWNAPGNIWIGSLLVGKSLVKLAGKRLAYVDNYLLLWIRLIIKQ